MKSNFVALQGKKFIVELQSRLGSTNYGWCVTSIPKEIILMNMETIPVGGGTASVIQKFCFGVVSSENINVEIDFALTCWSDLTEVSDYFKASVRIVPSNSEEFVSYKQEEANAVIPYGFVYSENEAMKYGYPCGVQEANLKYGYPCMEASKDARPYGYVCGVQDSNLKYGYPCMEASKDARPYGYPYWE